MHNPLTGQRSVQAKKTRKVQQQAKAKRRKLKNWHRSVTLLNFVQQNLQSLAEIAYFLNQPPGITFEGSLLPEKNISFPF